MKGSRTPDAPFTGLDGTKLGDFWRWAYSDLMDNTIRPVLAEFIVGSLLGVESEGRVSWDAADLVFRGRPIEVKSSGYLQTWHQNGPSRIVFDIGKKRLLETATNTYAPTPTRHADCYVFCLLTCQDPTTANPMDLANWRFWVLATRTINDSLGDQKSVALSRLEGLTRAVTASQLKAEVGIALGVEGGGADA